MNFGLTGCTTILQESNMSPDLFRGLPPTKREMPEFAEPHPARQNAFLRQPRCRTPGLTLSVERYK